MLATGGTIAGQGSDPTLLNNYTAGALAGDALLAAVPQLQELAAIDVEQIANVDSADLLFEHWRALVVRIRDAFAADPHLAGVVITHGTNTLEETAWLLQLLIDDARPVVLVGAMRPATALSADEPLNCSRRWPCPARGHGVLVLMMVRSMAPSGSPRWPLRGWARSPVPVAGPWAWWTTLAFICQW